MKKKLTLITFFYFVCIIPIFSEVTTIGGYNNFHGFSLNDTSRDIGKAQKSVLKLSPGEYKKTVTTDILLHFNHNFEDSTGKYKVKKHYDNITQKEKKLGDGSAYFFNTQEIIYESSELTIFTPNRVLRDFSIEFWLNPTLIGEDSQVFTWHGINRIDSRFIQQKISAHFIDRNLQWDFENIFVPQDFSNFFATLRGKTRLIPNSWSHHLLRYDSETGMLEYLMNGIPEDVTYTTRDSTEGSEIIEPLVGNFSKNELFLGSRYRGFIDEFRISEEYILNPNLSLFRQNGEFISEIIELHTKLVTLNKLDPVDYIPRETQIKYYYRFSDVPFNHNSTIKWEPYTSFKPGASGKYFQLKGELYSNGESNDSPEFYNMNLYWNEIRPPAPPLNIEIVKNKKAVTLNWEIGNYLDISGYKIYWGTKSNNYQEIVDIGLNSTYTIENLKSNNIYYFSVRAYNSAKIEGEYSVEVYARPD